MLSSEASVLTPLVMGEPPVDHWSMVPVRLVVPAMPETPAAAYTSTVSGVALVAGSTQLPIRPLAWLAGLSLSTATEGVEVSMRMSVLWPSVPTWLLTFAPSAPLTPAPVVA